MKILFLTIFNALLLATGQLLWKTGMQNKDIRSLEQMLLCFLNPYIIGGLMIYGVTTVLWLFIVSRADLSYVYPIQSFVLIIILLSSALIFKENVTLNRWIGAAFIALGVIIVGSR